MDSKSFILETGGNIVITVNDAKGVSYEYVTLFVSANVKCHMSNVICQMSYAIF